MPTRFGLAGGKRFGIIALMVGKNRSKRQNGSTQGKAASTKKSAPSRKSTTKKGRKRRGSSTKRNLKPLLFKLALIGVVAGVGWLVYLDALVTSKFEGHKWAVPAKVYARPLELYAGAEVSQNELQNQLRRQGYIPVQNIQRPGTFSRSGNTLTIHTRDFLFPDGPEPGQEVRIRFSGQSIQQMQHTDGKPISLLRLDPQLMGGIYPANYEDRILVHLDQVPDYLIKGLIAVEDRDFYHHHGVSLKGIARAMLANIKAGHWVQGGSTLTQQLVKNFYLTNRRSLWRKIQEIPMAVLLELHYSKQEILESYLNEVFLGQQGRLAIHGFGTASQFYFAQPIRELSPSRAALLIALVKGASFYNPWRNPERALDRRNLVLDTMADQGILSEAEAMRAKKQPLGIVSKQRLKTNLFPAYLDLVKRQLQEDYDEKDLTSEGLRIFTNMDPLVQQQAQEALAKTVKNLNDKKLEGAVVVTNAQTGDLQALIGGIDSGYTGFNRALDAKRSVGSLIKPAIYLTALEHPDKYTLTTLIDDDPFTLKLPNGQVWEPRNYGRKSHGEVPLYMALAKSYNIASARLGMDLGLSDVYKTLHQLGIEDLPSTPMPSTLLGGVDLTPLDMTHMYQTIASGGFRLPIQAIRSVQTADGELLQRFGFKVKQVIDPDAAFLLQYAMQAVMREGTGRSAYWSLPKSMYLAGKTGTSNNNRDSWFAGFSQDQLAVVWLGHDDNSSTRFTGAGGALKVWTQFMRNSDPQPLQPLVPEGIEYSWIDSSTGLRSSESCAGSKLLPFIDGSEPTQRIECAQNSGRRVIDWLEKWLK